MMILVTGACGFVGSAIVKQLKKDGNQVIGVGSSENCKCELVDTYYKCDISKKNDIDNLIKKFPKCDVVVHAAAIISFDNLDNKTIQVNCIGTQQIGRYALATGVKQIVYISSIPIVSKPENIPVTEENNKDNPFTLYHLSKLMGEKILLLPEFKKIVISILRLSAPISPDMPKDRMLPFFLKKALIGEPITLHGKGNRVQNYVDTRDVGNAVSCSIRKFKSGLFLIGGESMSNNEVANLCIEICDSKEGINFTGKLDPEEEFQWIISNGKSWSELGYKPNYTVKDVLIEMKESERSK